MGMDTDKIASVYVRDVKFATEGLVRQYDGNLINSQPKYLGTRARVLQCD